MAAKVTTAAVVVSALGGVVGLLAFGPVGGFVGLVTGYLADRHIFAQPPPPQGVRRLHLVRHTPDKPTSKPDLAVTISHGASALAAATQPDPADGTLIPHQAILSILNQLAVSPSLGQLSVAIQQTAVQGQEGARASASLELLQRQVGG